MLSKNQIKYIRSLKVKKFRQQYGRFIAEGDKIIKELLNSPAIEIEELFALKEWIAANNINATEINTKELQQISNLKTPNDVLAVVKIAVHEVQHEGLQRNLSLALDRIQDPGNMGTIIRTADWFDVKYLICSPDCADIYNPKVVQATMGSIARVKVVYCELPQFFEENKQLPVYGAVLDGEYLEKIAPPKEGIILIGNESSGISKELLPFVSKKITIPKFGKAESLNASVAAGIICAWGRGSA